MTRRLATAEWADPETYANEHAFEEGKFWLGRSPLNGEPLGYADDRHICLVSGSRSGKGTTIIINNLCLWPGSLVAIDPKGENATVTAVRRGAGSEHCEGMGQDVHVLDPFRAAQVEDSLRSRFNPLDELDPANPATIDEAGRLADAIVVVNPQSNDPFWEQSARTMLKGLILHVLTAPQFEGRRNLVTIRSLIARGDHEGQKVLRDMGEEDVPSGQSLLWEGVARSKAFNGVVAGIGESMVNMTVNAAKQFESVLQVANRNTEFLDSPGMQECLLESDFKLAELKTNPKGVSVFLCLPQRYMGEHFRWLRMVTTLLLTEMEAVNGPPATGHRVLVCLDEFAGLKRMEVIENAVAQIAGFGVKLFFVLQSLEQLKAVYKDTWETFLGNCGTRMFFGISDAFTAEYISSKLIGDTEVIRTTRSHNEGESTSSTTSKNTNEGTNWSEGENTGRSTGESRSSNAKAMPFFLRDTAAFFRAISGNRQTGTNENWGSSSGTNSSHGGSKGVGEGSSKSSSRSENRGTNESVHKRPLITPDEIGQYFARIDDETLPIYPGLGLVLLTGQQAGIVRRTNYFEDHQFVRFFIPHPDYAETPQNWTRYNVKLSEIGARLIGYALLEWPAMDSNHYRLVTRRCPGKHRGRTEWLVEPGDHVKEGDPIFDLCGLTPPWHRLEEEREFHKGNNGEIFLFSEDDFRITVCSPFTGRINQINPPKLGTMFWFSQIPGTSTTYGEPLHYIRPEDISFSFDSTSPDPSGAISVVSSELLKRCEGKSLFVEQMIRRNFLKRFFGEDIGLAVFAAFLAVGSLFLASHLAKNPPEVSDTITIPGWIIWVVGIGISLWSSAGFVVFVWNIWKDAAGKRLKWVLLSDPRDLGRSVRDEPILSITHHLPPENNTTKSIAKRT